MGLYGEALTLYTYVAIYIYIVTMSKICSNIKINFQEDNILKNLDLARKELAKVKKKNYLFFFSK